MSNPFATSQMNNTLAPLRDIYNALVNSQNPMQVFSSLASRNPQMKPILQMLSRGTNPQQIFTELCRQRGIDPNEFMRLLTNKY